MTKGILVTTVFLILIVLQAGSQAHSVQSEMVKVEGGILRPFYPPSPKEKEIPIKAFLMDKKPITQGEFLDFVKKNSQWRRDKIKRIFADDRYLASWQGPTTLPEKSELQPITQVSWFAAKAYCESVGKRLPTENEWEYAAQASEGEPDARGDMKWRNRVLDWYTRSAPKKLPSVAQDKPNYWGIFNLHGLVWEWVLDFNSSLVSSDNRENAESTDKTRFCGAGAMVATETDDYPSYMRIAFRTSLKARYTTSNLGFRCAHDAQ
jgi:sulfatase modifying factor 1